jgi:hypothetical protein
MVIDEVDGEGWSNNYSHKHTHTKPFRVNFGFGPFQPMELVLENSSQKLLFFYFFQTICFWKAETELEMDLLEFLGSEVI